LAAAAAIQMKGLSQTAPGSILNIKLVLLGQSSVGKTSIVTVSEELPFVSDQSATIGACFHLRNVEIEGCTVKFHI
jgi:GTPase SAR1 family protein